MRLVVARRNHWCSACGELIYAGENCWQSEAYYSRIFHEDCYGKQGAKPFTKVCKTTKAHKRV